MMLRDDGWGRGGEMGDMGVTKDDILHKTSTVDKVTPIDLLAQ